MNLSEADSKKAHEMLDSAISALDEGEHTAHGVVLLFADDGGNIECQSAFHDARRMKLFSCAKALAEHAVGTAFTTGEEYAYFLSRRDGETRR